MREVVFENLLLSVFTTPNHISQLPIVDLNVYVANVSPASSLSFRPLRRTQYRVSHTIRVQRASFFQDGQCYGRVLYNKMISNLYSSLM